MFAVAFAAMSGGLGVPPNQRLSKRLCCVDGSHGGVEGGSMKRTRRPGPPARMPSGFTGFRFPPEVILLAVRWYLRYGLSYRDLEELLAERGIEVDHVTLYRWVQRFTPLLIDAARPVRHLARGPVVRRRDLRQGLRGLVLRLPGGQPAWPGHRRVHLAATRHRLRAHVLHRCPGCSR